MDKSVMRSPDEVMSAAIEMMLDGKEPTTLHDQMRLVNFIAVNTAPGLSLATCRLMKVLYPTQLGLVSDASIEQVVEFQESRR